MLKSKNYRKIKDIKTLNDLAVEYRKRNNLKEAYSICERIYELEPAPDILKQSFNLGTSHMRYHLVMAEILYLKGNYIEAQRILNKLKSLGKHLSDKFLILAKIHMRNKDYAKAIQEYEEMITTCPHRFDSILNGLLRVIKLEPFIEYSYKLIFKLYKDRGKEASLISELEHKLKEENYRQEHLVCILGHMYHYMGETVRAISLLAQYQKKNPNDAKLSFFIGNICLEIGKYSEAIIQYDNVIKLDPSKKTNIISSIEEISSNKKDINKHLENISIFPPERRSRAGAKSTLSTDSMKKLEERYENIENIGEGGMGIVYKAVDKVLKRAVAIKVIKEDYGQNSEAIERFIKEAQSLSRLQHNGIVTIYDINLGTPMYIIMEYVDGNTLRTCMKEKHLSLQEVLRIVMDTCDAIKCAHKHEVVHRDIKPDNIMLTRDGTVKISGFGLAHIANTSILTKTGQPLGRPYYMSPEQIKGQMVDGRSDIYSLGITVYEMLVGRAPFHEGDIAYQHINEPPKSTTLANPEMPRWLDHIIMKCLKKEPSERYQEVGHLLKELKSYSKFYTNL